MSSSRQVESEKDINSIHIDTAQIPTHARDELAAATLDFMHRILNQPGGREALNARITAKKAATAAR